MVRYALLPRRRFLSMVGLPALFSPLAGCSTRLTHPGGDERVRLLARAREYWAAVQSNDLVKAWSFEEVSKDPRWTLQSYLKRGGVVYDAVEVRGVKALEQDKAQVEVWMRYSFPIARVSGVEGVTDDEWRLLDGQWYHVLRRSAIFGDQ